MALTISDSAKHFKPGQNKTNAHATGHGSIL
jgi:hypothetical protein